VNHVDNELTNVSSHIDSIETTSHSSHLSFINLDETDYTNPSAGKMKEIIDLTEDNDDHTDETASSAIVKKNQFNIFDHVGKNYPHFLPENVESAVTENYSGEKFADFICTEDALGYLVLIPASHVSNWAKLSGELRPTGRNSCAVWTPNKLISVLKEKGGSVKGETVSMPIASFKQAKARGGEKVSRFKISPLFFLYSNKIENSRGKIIFQIGAVKQNIPTITTKMNFKKLQISEVKDFYTDNIRLCLPFSNLIQKN
jgi:hypothetical protein